LDWAAVYIFFFISTFLKPKTDENRSVVSNLVEFTHLTLNEIESGYQMDCVYTDLSKAFDVVDHGIVVSDLYRNDSYQIAGSMINWTGSYLCGRYQFVKINSSKSEPFLVSSGVPQGSHMGPTIFLLLFDKVKRIFSKVNFLFYADDLKIFHSIRNHSDCLDLQIALNLFYEWCIENKLILNVKKCHVMSFTRKQIPFVFDYKFEGISISRPESIKDLGVVFDSKLSFNLHINYIVSRSMSMLGFLKRFGREFSDPYILKTIFCAFIRSVLEFGCCIWSPYYAIHIARIEGVQRNFLRFALRNLGWSDPFRLPPYKDRCKLLTLKTLNGRRNVLCVMLVRDLLSNAIDSPFLISKINLHAPVYALRETEMIRVQFHRTTYGQNEPIAFAIKKFNEFAYLYEIGLSRENFKNKLMETIE
jgi:hypothetical protein